jgi:dolichol-phosphate mannosyltransferase
MPELKISSVSVILPTYNEAGHIQNLIQAIIRELTENNITDFELIVADDDSPDLTWEKAGQTPGVDASKVKVLRRMDNHGLTASIRDGIAASKKEVVVWLDCDFSHPPEKIGQMLYMLSQGFDVVVNSRFTIGGGEERTGKGGPIQLILSHTLNWGIRFMLAPSFSDYTSGFVAVRRTILERFILRGDYGEYFIDFIYRILKTKKYRVCELPYIAMPRRSGESKTGSTLIQYFRRGWKYLWTVVKLRIPIFDKNILPDS